MTPSQVTETIPEGWSADFDAAPTDTPLWIYATDDQGYAYGVAAMWKRGNPGEPKLIWTGNGGHIRDVEGIEKALLWHLLPNGPGLDVLDAVCAVKAPNTSAAKSRATAIRRGQP